MTSPVCDGLAGQSPLSQLQNFDLLAELLNGIPNSLDLIHVCDLLPSIGSMSSRTLSMCFLDHGDLAFLELRSPRPTPLEPRLGGGRSRLGTGWSLTGLREHIVIHRE